MKLYVEKSVWTGKLRNPDDSPIVEQKNFKFEPEKGKKYVLDYIECKSIFGKPKMKEKFCFTIIDIQDDYIIIKTNKVMGENNVSPTRAVEEGKKEFKIEVGVKKILDEPIYDVGKTYVFELK